LKSIHPDCGGALSPVDCVDRPRINLPSSPLPADPIVTFLEDGGFKHSFCALTRLAMASWY
jgi:hypothetical protein